MSYPAVPPRIATLFLSFLPALRVSVILRNALAPQSRKKNRGFAGCRVQYGRESAGGETGVSVQQGMMIGVSSGGAATERFPWSSPERALGSGEGEEGSAAEAALLRAGQAGDRAALERLVARHKRPLFGLCYGILGHAEDAEDAVQETFLRALRGLPGFRADAAFRTWLYRIAVNVCLNWKRDRRPTEWLDEQRRAAADAPSPETIALRQLQVREALRALLPRHRAILLLREREGWSLDEIGAALRWSRKRVERELSLARHALAAWRQQTREGDEG
jgi:RNA polymerase sigma-70 factor (ECF subfamily)